jgi:hypothetical protein
MLSAPLRALIVIAIGIAWPAPAPLQAASNLPMPSPTAPADLDPWLQIEAFYQDPRPERVEPVIAFMDSELPQLAQGTHDGAVAFLSGWLTVVFARWPERVPDWIRPTRGATTMTAFAWSLSRVGLPTEALEAGRRAGFDQDRLEQLEELRANFELQRPRHGVDLDQLWGAAFASGDGRYVRPLVRLLNDDLGEQHARDVVQLASQQPGTAERILKGRTQEEASQMLLYSAAFWALVSNSRRYRFVLEEVQQGAKLPLTLHGKLLIGAIAVAAAEDVRPAPAPSP